MERRVDVHMNVQCTLWSLMLRTGRSISNRVQMDVRATDVVVCSLRDDQYTVARA